MRIAIIGAGISGLGAAYLLRHAHQVTLYEKNTHCGGHSRTIDVQVGGVRLAADTGFMVCNERNYPLLFGLLRHLGVALQPAPMSFGVSIDDGWLEYGSDMPFALLGQRRNLLQLRF